MELLDHRGSGKKRVFAISKRCRASVRVFARDLDPESPFALNTRNDADGFVVALEYRHLATTYGGAIGEQTATYLNLGMGVEF